MFFLLVVVLVVGCFQEVVVFVVVLIVVKVFVVFVNVENCSYDESLYVELDKVVIKDIVLDLKLDFDQKQIGGIVIYILEWKQKDVRQLVFDICELIVFKVEVVVVDGVCSLLKFELVLVDKVFGSKLIIEVVEQLVKVEVIYYIVLIVLGLQWLVLLMIEGKKLFFMFSQLQVIYVCFWVLLQDILSVCFIYSVYVVLCLDVMVLMSVDNDLKVVCDGDYIFKMLQLILFYLFVIVVGDLVFELIFGCFGVWVELIMVNKVVKEFEDIEKMIGVVEKFYGEYCWGCYDMLVLLLLFLFGGMENLCLIFVILIVIVGDKLFVLLVVYELVYSWLGNLVINVSWKDIWFNEGFIIYVQGCIIEVLYGKEMVEMEKQIDQIDLLVEVKDMSLVDQVLVLLLLNECDFDEVFSQVVYVKGVWFLEFLEQCFGCEIFDLFLWGWFDDYVFQSVNIDQFVDYMKKNLLLKNLLVVIEVELKVWLDELGILVFVVKVQLCNFSSVDIVCIVFVSVGIVFSSQVIVDWSMQEWVCFIDGLGVIQLLDKLVMLDKVFYFIGILNGEIVMCWYLLVICSGYEQVNEGVVVFIECVGCCKLILLIYVELVKILKGLELVKQVFEKVKLGYYLIIIVLVQDMLVKVEVK